MLFFTCRQMHLDLKNASDGLDLNQLDGLDSGILAWRQFT
jgi:hypothetical protein